MALNGYAFLVIGISKILMTSNSTKVARRIMELEHDDLLVDHIQFDETLKYRI